MKHIVEQMLANALSHILAQGKIPNFVDIPPIKVERTKDSSHGDYASNIALTLSHAHKMPTKLIADWIVAVMPTDASVERVEVAEPGFINFFMKAEAWSHIVLQILEEAQVLTPKSVNLESKINDTSLYDVQYAHARICLVFRQLSENGFLWDEKVGLLHLDLLTTPEEHNLLALLWRTNEIAGLVDETRQPHQIVCYLKELANGLHSYYNAIQILCENEMLRQARLCLLVAVCHVLKNGLQLLGLSSPRSM